MTFLSPTGKDEGLSNREIARILCARNSEMDRTWRMKKRTEKKKRESQESLETLAGVRKKAPVKV